MSNNNTPINVKISFGIIVLNGEPFTKYCLRSLYKHAHEIIVVEGATSNATSLSTPDGHSRDNTLSVIRGFIDRHDPQKKIRLITRDGYWKEKDEMSKAYAKIATGNVLWQVDVDEFYKDEDIDKIARLFATGAVDTISVNTLTFWGDTKYIANGFHLIRGNREYHRIFRFGPDFVYKTHRPPTVLDNNGIDLREKTWLRGDKLEKQYNIVMYHYSLLFPLQVEEKMKYYSAWARAQSSEWALKCYFQLSRPFHVHNVYERISWLERYKGDHPKEINQMMHDLRESHEKVFRNNRDVEKLLNRFWYRSVVGILKLFGKIIVSKKHLRSIFNKR